MRYFAILFSLLLFSVFCGAQSQRWNLYINKTKRLSAAIDTVQAFQLSKGEKGTLRFNFPGRSKEFIRTVIIMNDQRNDLLEKNMKTSCQTASFRLDTLLSKTGGSPFMVYVRDLPADPQKAMLVRVAPVAICKVQWVE